MTDPTPPPPPIELDLAGFTHGGEAVGRSPEGKAVFVPGGIPGERVRVRIVDDRKRWARAELVEVLDASPDRVVPPCIYVPECGGCDLQHIAPEAQRRLKTRVVREQLERLGKLEDPPVADCRPVGPDVGYRNHARFHADDEGRLGFHRAGTHDVVPIDQCLVLGVLPERLHAEVGDAGGAVEVDVRGHTTTATAAIVLHPGPGGLTLPDVTDADVLVAQPDGTAVPMRGQGVLAERVAGHTYRFPATSFFQVNSGGADAIVAEVLAAAGDVLGARVWDLYAGVGLLAVPLAVAGAEVTAVEADPQASVWTALNAEDAGVRLDVVDSTVEAFVRRPTGGPGDRPDLVVLDPPRSGAGIEVVRRITGFAPDLVIYVACDPAALARDARVLADRGYTLRHAQPLDLFPMTSHVEVVATFARGR